MVVTKSFCVKEKLRVYMNDGNKQEFDDLCTLYQSEKSILKDSLNRLFVNWTP